LLVNFCVVDYIVLQAGELQRLLKSAAHEELVRSITFTGAAQSSNAPMEANHRRGHPAFYRWK
jgi:hypothetical protein